MKFTFGIITSGLDLNNINLIYDSILAQKIDDDFELIVIGGKNPNLELVRHFEFDESIKPAWITKKKNLIAEYANYDNICMMHDYVFLYENWYNNFREFGEDWDVCMNSIINHDGQRFRDWITWPEWCDENNIIFLDYEDHSRTEQMYVSGTYFCAKKKFLLDNPFDEQRSWGQSEDVEWSGRCRHRWNYKCNSDSRVGFLKQKVGNDHWHNEANKKIREAWNND
jgi:hypothetical protein